MRKLSSEYKFSLFILSILIFLNWSQGVSWLQELVLNSLKIDILPLVNFLTINISDIFLLLLITFFVDSRISKKTLLIKSDDIKFLRSQMSLLIEISSPSGFLQNCLETIYGRQDAKSLSNVIASSKSIYFDTTVSLRLISEASAQDKLHYIQEINFSTTSERIVIAIIESSTLQDQVFNSPNVDEVFCITSTSSDDIFSFQNKIIVEQIVKDSAGQTTCINIPLKPVNKSDKRKFEKETNTQEGQVAFYYIKAPKTDRSEPSRYKIKYPEAQFAYSIPFVYWVADRPMHLSHITIDAARLRDKDKTSISIMPNISALKSNRNLSRISPKDFPIEVTVDSWITYGQGVIISWNTDND